MHDKNILFQNKDFTITPDHIEIKPHQFVFFHFFDHIYHIPSDVFPAYLEKHHDPKRLRKAVGDFLIAAFFLFIKLFFLKKINFLIGSIPTLHGYIPVDLSSALRFLIFFLFLLGLVHVCFYVLVPSYYLFFKNGKEPVYKGLKLRELEKIRDLLNHLCKKKQ